jgi:hypothetical protein
MKRQLILLTVRCFLVLSVYAQVEAVPDSTLKTMQPTSTNDTTHAIHRLFLAKRQSATLITASGLGVAGGTVLYAIVIQALVGSALRGVGVQAEPANPFVATAKVSLPSLFIGIMGAIKLERFNQEKEDAVLLEYQQNHALPVKIRRQLKPEHFQQNKEWGFF